MAKIKVKRCVYKNKRDESNLPHVEVQVYSMEDACYQGFLCTMVDDDHYIVVSEVSEENEV